MQCVKYLYRYLNKIYFLHYVDGLMQKRRNSIANVLKLHLFCIKPLIYNGVSHST